MDDLSAWSETIAKVGARSRDPLPASLSGPPDTLSLVNHRPVIPLTASRHSEEFEESLDRRHDAEGFLEAREVTEPPPPGKERWTDY